MLNRPQEMMKKASQWRPVSEWFKNMVLKMPAKIRAAPAE